ncbi:MAG: 1-acyl-sn-glycerol-3-phosphate acyltransferase [Frankia sp.]
MRTPPWVVRRPLFVAVIMMVAVVSGPAAAIAAVLGVPWAIAGRLGGPPVRWRPLRIAAMAVVYSWLETVALVACFGLWLTRPALGRPRYLAAHVALLRWTLDVLRRAVERITGFVLLLEEPPEPFGLATPGPVIVVSRHGGIGDSFLLAQLLLSRWGRTPRVVLKDALRLDPAVDVMLGRIGACFVPAGRDAGADVTDRVRAFAASLGPGDALLIFPEGGNYTPRRRIRAIENLRRRGHRAFAALAEQMPHVLPPRPDGVLAALEAIPAAPVSIVAHTGFDDLVSARAVWDALPLSGRPLRLRWWTVSPSHVPAGDEARLRWLLVHWAIVDQWIDYRRAAPSNPRPADPLVPDPPSADGPAPEEVNRPGADRTTEPADPPSTGSG